LTRPHLFFPADLKMYIYTFDIKIGTAEVYDTYIMDYGGP